MHVCSFKLLTLSKSELKVLNGQRQSEEFCQGEQARKLAKSQEARESPEDNISSELDSEDDKEFLPGKMMAATRR